MTQHSDAKSPTLKDSGSLNLRPERITDPFFLDSEFFDACDLVQVKYEMLRRVRAEGMSVTQAAAAFGFSRPAFYQALAALEGHGLAGLIPKRPINDFRSGATADLSCRS